MDPRNKSGDHANVLAAGGLAAGADVIHYLLQRLEADCAGCPGMMCTREQECRDRGWGSGELDAFNFACPQFLSVSSDGAYVAFVVDVTHDTVSCWANGYRCGEGTHEVVRSVVFVVPLQR